MNGIIRIGTEINTKKFDQQIAKLERELKQKQKTLSTLLEVQSKEPKSNLTQGIEDLRASIEKTENSIVSLNEKKKKLEDDRGKKQYLKEGLDDAFKSAKRLIGGIIGIRAAYGLIRKASSAYLSDNEETTSKIEALWTGLGTIMGPVIEYITGLLKKAVTAVLYFMSVLTGTNYVAKANEAILRKQAKATEKLTKATDKYNASFDEMNVIGDTSKSGDTSTASLFDVNDLSENVRSAIEKIGEALQPVYKILKDIIKYSLEHPEVILGILGGVGLLSMIGKIIGYAGAGTAVGTGLAGILGVLLAIASIGVITISIKKVIEEVQKYQEEQQGAIDTIEGNVKSGDKLRSTIAKLTKTQEKGSEAIKRSVSAYKMLSQSSKIHIEDLIEEGVKTKGITKLVNDWDGRTEALGKQIKIETNEIFKNAIALGELYKAGKLDEEQKKDYTDVLRSLTDNTEIATLSTNELANKFLLSRDDAESLKTQYDMLATELYRMYKNGDITIDTLNRLPKEVRTKIESNLDENIEKLDEVYDLVNNLPMFKRINVETKITADDTQAKSVLNNLFRGMGSMLDPLDKLLGTRFSYSLKNIKLAQGGIVNNPGKGVSLGSNIIAGEAGAEAVLPLDDTTLGMLGRKIADNMVVNLTNINQMNGRIISKELQRVQNESDFAFNR